MKSRKILSKPFRAEIFPEDSFYVPHDDSKVATLYNVNAICALWNLSGLFFGLFFHAFRTSKTSRPRGDMTQGNIAATCCSHKITCCSYIGDMFVCAQCDFKFIAATCVPAARHCYMSPTCENTRFCR